MTINGVVFGGTKLLGMVMLLKPKLPLSPVTVKYKPVVVALFAAIVTLDICVLVMFPLRVRFTVLPLSVKIVTVEFACVTGVGVGFRVDVGVGVLFEEPNAKRVPSSKPTYSIPSATAEDDQISELGLSSW